MARSGGGFRIFLSADSKGLDKGLNDAQSSIDKFARGTERQLSRAQASVGRFAHGAGRLSAVGSGLSKVSPGLGGIAAGMVSIGGATAFLESAVKSTEDLYLSTKRLSRVTGLDTTTASAWVSMAKTRGIESNTLTRSFTTLAKQLRLAQGGSQGATKAFNDLGVSQEMIRRGNTSQIIESIAESFKHHADGSGKAALASQLFGRNYQGMLGVMNGGRKNLRDLLRDEVLHGAVLGKNTKQLEAGRLAHIRFNQAMDKLKVTVGVALMPYITRLSNTMTKWLQNASNKKRIDDMVKAFAGIAKQVLAVTTVLVPMISAVGRFVGKHPGVVKLVADLVAFKLALKLISFANPLSGLAGLIGRGRVAAGVLRGLGGAAAGGGRGIMAALTRLTPRLAALLTGWNALFATRMAAMGTTAGAALSSTFLLAVAPIAAFMATFNAFANGGTGKQRSQFESGVDEFGNPRLRNGFGLSRSATAGSLLSQLGNGRATGNFAAGLASFSKPAAGMMPNYTNSSSSSTVPAQNTSGGHHSTAKKKGHTGLTPAQALNQAMKKNRRDWWVPFESRLRKISIHNHTLAAERQRKTIMEQGVAAWKSLRPQMVKYANDAHKGGDGEIFGRIWDLIHKGDAKTNEWKQKLPAVKDSIALQGSQDAIDNANKRTEIVQSNLNAESAFLRTAFGFGDIGSGGSNAYLAAGGPATSGNQRMGGNVHITINSLHPGDSKTKAQIAGFVTGALASQGSRRTSQKRVG